VKNLFCLGLTMALVVCSSVLWLYSVGVQPQQLGPGLRLAAALLVMAWLGFLVWLCWQMRRQELSAGYCTVLFFGGWAVFFLGLNCLV